VLLFLRFPVSRIEAQATSCYFSGLRPGPPFDINGGSVARRRAKSEASQGSEKFSWAPVLLTKTFTIVKFIIVRHSCGRKPLGAGVGCLTLSEPQCYALLALRRGKHLDPLGTPGGFVISAGGASDGAK